MRSIRFSLLVIASFFINSCFGQTKNEVYLKWKLQPNDSLTYQWVSQNLDTATNSNTVDLSGFLNLVMDTAKLKLPDSLKNKYPDSVKILKQKLSDPVSKAGMQEIFNKFIKSSIHNNDTLNISLKRRQQNTIDIIMKNPTEPVVMLRGVIYDSGDIQSFYVQNNQKNIIALFFQLPDKPVKVGDSWSINTNLISADQNFECDSSYKRNQVTLVNVTKKNNETIAVIKYDIVEFISGEMSAPFFGNSPIKTTMKFKYDLTAEFSIEKGKWVSYNGIQSISSTGLTKSNANKRLSLLPK